MRRRFAWMLACLLLSSAAAPGGAAERRISPQPDLPPASYFPLEAGSRWEYRVTSHFGGEEITYSRTLTEGAWVVARNRVAYLRLEDYAAYPRLVRVTPASTVLEFDALSGREVLWYRLGAPEGTTWRSHIYDHVIFTDSVLGSQATLVSRHEAITVPAGTFSDVVRVDFTHPGESFVTHSEWFAPGVGLIRRQVEGANGTTVMELAAANLGPAFHLGPRYAATLSLDRPVYENNLMPPVGPDSAAMVNAVFSLRNRTVAPVILTFTGCPSATFSVLDSEGLEVLRTRVEDDAHGCCSCSNPENFVLQDGVLAFAATFRLVGADGMPLPDGRYTVVAILDSLDSPGTRPSAGAVAQVVSVQ